MTQMLADTVSAGEARDNGTPLLEVRDLVKEFHLSRGRVIQAVSGVSLDVFQGETLGLVGESGCGKSTLARTIARLTDPTAGSIRFAGQDLAPLTRAQMRPVRKRLQFMFQNPQASLHPRMRAGDIIAEPLRLLNLSRGEVDRHVARLLEQVNLAPEHASRYPHEFSGGQRQRIGIARALAVSPDLIILDEPVSALDVSIQAGILNLLKEIQAETGIAYLFISHDLSVVRHLCDRIAVMYLGKIVEVADSDVLYGDPRHPYTKSLLSAVPLHDPVREKARERIVLTGDVPSPAAPPSGCRFHPRCFNRGVGCHRVAPKVTAEGPRRAYACHYPLNAKPNLPRDLN